MPKFIKPEPSDSGHSNAIVNSEQVTFITAYEHAGYHVIRINFSGATDNDTEWKFLDESLAQKSLNRLLMAGGAA